MLLHESETCTSTGKRGLILAIDQTGLMSNKTVEFIKQLNKMIYIEFNQNCILSDAGLEIEINRVIDKYNDSIANGFNVLIFTKSNVIDSRLFNNDYQKLFPELILDAISALLSQLTEKPAWFFLICNELLYFKARSVIDFDNIFYSQARVNGKNYDRISSENKQHEIPFLFVSEGSENIEMIEKIINQ